MQPYSLLAALPAVLALSGFVVFQLLRRSGTGDAVTRRIVEKLRREAPDSISPDQRLHADQVERVLTGDQRLRELVGEQDFLLLKQTLRQQFIISLTVYALATVLCALSIVLFLRHENASKQLSLANISLADANDNAKGLVVDLEPINVKWVSSGEADDIDVYLENVQTGMRTAPLRCHSAENAIRFEKDDYKSLLSNREKGQNNRIRAVLQTKKEHFSSLPADVAVGITVLTLLDKRGVLTVAAMIDNSRIPYYDFEAKIVVPARAANRAPLAIGPQIPYRFKSIKVPKPREFDWNSARGVYFSPDDARLVRFDWLIDGSAH